MFVTVLGHASNKTRVVILIGEMDTSRLMVYVQHVKEEKARTENNIEARELSLE